ncbi:hypothetical protein LEP48_01710 [Isoptericola sp. NEAU-Y5]|uniref:Uncharacterized protein n=1 Tax=Isoptericola luteus TaxID=2879484 RepID=A0ABS7ZAH8_9MICO|nr:hypothetical protein [Isoptericola sp. NEAU-Y5]MCA5892067.1 hypothetical protein [Isoptericola sp. NEAU-Y5]
MPHRETSAVSRPAAPTGGDAPPRSIAWIAGWTVVGIVSGIGIVFGLGGSTSPGDGAATELATTASAPATAVAVAALCYLAAAATGLRWVGWAAVPVASALPFLAFVGVPRWLPFAVAGLALLLLGLVRRRPTTLAQGAAMVAYYGVALAGVGLAPRAGLVVAGLALAAHAAWDLVHYRRDVVVHQSLAVWCIGLDLTVGGICLTLAVLG